MSYGTPGRNSIVKEVGFLTDEYRRVVEAAPLFVLATAGPEGLDCSPRGDGPGSVEVVGSTTLRFADRRGNNRIDSLRNIVVDDRVAMLFLVPGMSETLRVNGRACVRTDPDLIRNFAFRSKDPATVVEVEIEAVFFQCSRALVRSDL